MSGTARSVTDFCDDLTGTVRAQAPASPALASPALHWTFNRP